jgi:integrase
MWSLPGSRTKNGNAHTVPLAPLALDIIEAMPRKSDEFVFSLNGAQPVENFSLMKRKLDALTGITESWTLHDLRRTCATGLQKLRVRLEVCEKCLNHTGSLAGIAGVYQRHTFDDEKRDALTRWADKVEELVAKSNVVKLPSRKAS